MLEEVAERSIRWSLSLALSLSFSLDLGVYVYLYVHLISLIRFSTLFESLSLATPATTPP